MRSSCCSTKKEIWKLRAIRFSRKALVLVVYVVHASVELRRNSNLHKEPLEPVIQSSYCITAFLLRLTACECGGLDNEFCRARTNSLCWIALLSLKSLPCNLYICKPMFIVSLSLRSVNNLLMLEAVTGRSDGNMNTIVVMAIKAIANKLTAQPTALGRANPRLLGSTASLRLRQTSRIVGKRKDACWSTTAEPIKALKAIYE